MSVVNLSSSQVDITKVQNGTPGTPGLNGYNQATIYLYVRDDSAPSAPADGLIYDFAAGTFTTGSIGSWSQTLPPDNGKPCFVAVTIAISNQSTDEIDHDDWTIRKLVKDGGDGQPGLNGYNQATIFLYKRSSTTLGQQDTPTATSYNFETGVLTGYTQGWSTYIPSGNDPCYVSSAAIIDRNNPSTSITFVTPTKLVEDGQNGQDGRGISSTVVEYQISNDGTYDDSGTWSSTIPSTIAQGKWLITRTTITYTTGGPSKSYSKAYMGTNGQPGSDGNGIASTIVEYVIDNQGSTAPSSGWSTTFPSSISSGDYLWTRTTITYDEGPNSISYSVSRDGVNGNDGKSIIAITEYYALSDSNSQAPVSGWDTNVVTPTAALPYAWNYETITYSTGSPTNTDPHVVAMYSASGTDGRGISSIVDLYATSTDASITPADGAFSTTIPTLDATNRYLWNREQITYTSAPLTGLTSKHIIGMYSQDGQSISVTNTTIDYCESSNGQTAPSSGWTGTPPATATPGYFLWTRTTITFNNGDISVSYSVTRNGADGTSVTITSTSHSGTTTTVNFSDGTSITIEDGAKGKEISTITEYYKAGNSSTTAPTGTWSTSVVVPTASNPYLWNYEYIIYSDSTHSETSKRIIGTYSAPGTPGQDGKGISAITNYYAKTSTTTAPSTSSQDWVACPPGSIPTIDQTDKYLWNYEHTLYTDNTTSNTTPHIISMYAKDGEDGEDGENGNNFIILYYYQRNNNTPNAPTGTYSYNFSNKTISPSISSSWTNSIPTTDGTPCWVTTISFLGNTTTVSGQSFTTPVKLVEDGEDGEDAGKFTIHTNYEEILKFNSNSQNSNTITYSFAPSSELQIGGYDLIELSNIPIVEYSKVNIDSTTFNANKTLYYYKNNQNDYVQCTNSSVYSSSTQYYIRNTYFTIQVQISSYKLNEIIKPAYYERYLYNKLNTDDEYYYYFNFQNLYLDLYDGSLNSKINDTDFIVADVITNLKLFFESFSSEDIIIFIQVHQLDASILNAEKYIQIKNGLNEQMVKFSVNAADITAAIENTGLRFDLEGLTVTNGGFKIQTGSNNNYTDVFFIDENTGRLYMNGDGVFSGTIHATDGEFSGTVTSSSGNIGGFEISEHSISSNDLTLNSSYTENGVVKESSITVKNIDIGKGARVSGSVTVGNLKLLNPNENNGNVLALVNGNTNYFTLTNEGNVIGNNWSIQDTQNGVVADFGKIIAHDGEFSGTIHATDGDFSGSITSSVINASTINAASFVTEKTRAMGGTFIFKPTFEIENIETTSTANTLKITLNNDSRNYIPDSETGKDIIIGLSGDDTRYGKITSKNNNIINVYLCNTDYSTVLTQKDKYNTATIFGYGAQTDLLIGINSDDNNMVLPPRALVMEEFTNLINKSDTGDIDYNIRLLLGDLSGAPEGIGYGLYADNVFLRGSLTTAGNSGSNNNYAGINTQRTISFNYNDWNAGISTGEQPVIYTDDNIIFWGGANGTEDGQIRTSPFIVTDKGNVFARSGEFKGSVISDSLITNTIIKAPIIWGNNSATNEPTLKIYNTDNTKGGIGFYKQIGNIDEESSETNDILTLVLSDNGFYYDSQVVPFINFNGGQIGVNVTNVNTGTTILRQNYLEDGLSYIQLNNGVNGVKIASSNASVEILTNEIINDATTVTNKNSMIVTNGNEMLKYAVNNGYYCLYVEE